MPVSVVCKSAAVTAAIRDSLAKSTTHGLCSAISEDSQTLQSKFVAPAKRVLLTKVDYEEVKERLVCDTRWCAIRRVSVSAACDEKSRNLGFGSDFWKRHASGVTVSEACKTTGGDCQPFSKVAGVTAATERPPAPQAPPQGPSSLQLTDEPHMSIAAAENAGLGPCDLPLSDPWVTHTTQTSGVCSLPLSSLAAVTAAVAVSSALPTVSIGGSYLQTSSGNTLLIQPQHQVQQQTSVDLHHSPQTKIMNAVATVPCPTAASSRIRKTHVTEIQRKLHRIVLSSLKYLICEFCCNKQEQFMNSTL